MKDLNKKAFGGLIFLVIAVAILLFLPAWTIYWWQAWVFLAVFSISVLLVTIYLMKNDPKLLERRVKAGPGAEKEKSQKTIQFIAQFAFMAVIILPAIDHRFGWSLVPLNIIILGDILVALGLLAVFFVFKENSYTSATIEVGPEQRLISTGPYAIVRHPMYSGAIIMLIGIPLSLGSWWGLFLVALMVVAIIFRLLDEEKFLIKNLAGYVEYQKKVKCRLVPFVW